MENLENYSEGELTLHLLSSALISYYNQCLPESPAHEGAIYPPTLQRAINHLEHLRLHLDDSHPWGRQILHVPRLLGWCHEPFASWPPSFIDELLVSPEDCLLDDGVPTRVCEEWGLNNSDVESELEQGLMKQVMDEAQKYGAPQIYTEFRRFICQHPTLLLDTLDLLRTDPMLGPVQQLLKNAYMNAPLGFAVDKSWYLCKFCKSLLVCLSNGKLVCENERCRARKGGVVGEGIADSEALLWLRRGIRLYTFYPGQSELRLAHQLEEIPGIKVELWPQYDRYDLSVLFEQSQEYWAIDVKDWRNPVLLAKRAHSIPSDNWTRAFFVFPEDRVRTSGPYPNYIQRFTTEAQRRGILRNGIEVLSEKVLVSEVRQHAEL